LPIAWATQEYAEQRDRHCPFAQPKTFFVSDSGAALKRSAVHATFVALRRRLGWADRPRHRPPRIHDLRHSFACRRLLAWYEEGADINQGIPALSTYLGHVRASDTYWYLTAIPDLMAIAAERFERQGRAR
jgi:integrase